MRKIDSLLLVLWKHVKGVLAFPRGLGVLAERAVRVLCRRLAARLSKVERARLLAEPPRWPVGQAAELLRQLWFEMRAELGFL